MPDTSTSTLPLLSLGSGVVLPQMVVTVAIETPEAAAAADAAREAGGELLVVPRLDDRWARVGTVASAEDAGRLAGGRRALLVRGLRRARLGAAVPGTGAALWVEAHDVPEPEVGERARQLAREYRLTLEQVLEHRGAPRIAEFLRGVTDPDALADVAGSSPDLSLERRVELLEAVDLEERLELVLGWAREELAELELREKIRHDVSEGMERTQREFLLRQQLEAIRRELGELGGADASAAPDGYRERVAAAGLPDDVRARVEREVDRLERTSEQSPEHGWIATWLDTVLELPWGVRAEERLDVGGARATLDADHAGLDDVKERIVEHLAVRKLRSERGRPGSRGAILALIGPPGVGKTSLGESVARATGRPYVRVALGGVRDEAEVRGHRRTYVGARPGRIVRALAEAGAMNPVLVLDEVDKVGSDWRGDPASALLEVLDPAQNGTFRDHYLELDLDLSDVLFIATANVVDTIPAPLLDRMELITLDGYTTDEKVAIARQHLLPRQVERAGLEPHEVDVDDGALRAVVEDHTREAGVRSLERQLARVLRKVAAEVAEDPARAPVHVGAGALSGYLGRPRHRSDPPSAGQVPGVATGLAVTGAGGDVLAVEATVMPGEPGLTITGQLGEVMQESAQIALSYLRSHPELAPGLDADHQRFHVHFPAGAVPKDGPSAGITVTTALVSLLTGRPVRAEVGMTGEVTLQGRVLPIGGVKQKLLAAHRAGLREVVLPERNGPDLDDVPEHVLADLRVHLVGDVRQVLELALAA